MIDKPKPPKPEELEAGGDIGLLAALVIGVSALLPIAWALFR